MPGPVEFPMPAAANNCSNVAAELKVEAAVLAASGFDAEDCGKLCCWPVVPKNEGSDEAMAAMYSSDVSAAFKSFAELPVAACANAAAAAIVEASFMAALRAAAVDEDDWPPVAAFSRDEANAFAAAALDDVEEEVFFTLEIF